MFNLLPASAGRFWLGDGNVPQRLTGRVQPDTTVGAEPLKKRTERPISTTTSDPAATLPVRSGDQTSLSKNSMAPRGIAATLSDSRVSPLGTAGPAGRVGAVQRAGALFAAYAGQSQVVLNAIYADGYADFIDTFGGTGRIRPDDAADAVLRLNASIWTVLRDVRSGTLRPSAFGKTDWEQVDARVLYDLGIKRLYDDAIDYDQAIPAMQSDAIWAHQPILINKPGEKPVELKPGNYSGFWKRSVYSTVAPNEAAESFESLQFARRIRDAAVAVADGTSNDVTATLGTAYSLYKGEGIAANASQAAAALVMATGINIFTDYDLTPKETTAAELDERRQRGEISGYIPAPNGEGFITYNNKSIRQICREIKVKLDQGKLNHLPAETRRKIEEMIGPVQDPGGSLQERVNDESSGRYWREFSSEVIVIAAVGLASGGVGAAAGGFATGLNAGRFAVGTARLVSTSASFTTMFGAYKGKIEPEQYLYDLALFGALSGAGRLIKLPKLKK